MPTAILLSKKIQSLRGSFRKELKKVIDSQRSGREANDVYKPALWYFNDLLFTRDQELSSSSISNLEDISCNERCELIWTQEDDIRESASHQSEEKIKDNDDALDAMASTPRLRKRKASTSNYQAELFKVCTDTLKSNSKELSEFEISGMNIATKLAKMDPVQAIYAESIINNVLRQGLLKHLTEDSDICNNLCNKIIPKASSDR